VTPIGFAGDALGYLEPFPGSARTPNLTRVAFVRESGDSASIEALRSSQPVQRLCGPVTRRSQYLAGFVNPGGAASSIWIADLHRGSPFHKVIDLPMTFLRVAPRGRAVID
jgi:hypothetical protein